MPIQGCARRCWIWLALAVLAGGSCGSPTEVVEAIDPIQVCGGLCWPGQSWTTAPSPASLGWSESGLSDAERYASEIGSDALMVVDRGLVVVDWGRTTRSHYVQSIRKSFVSALYGVVQGEFGIDLSRTLSDLGVDDSPSPLSASEKTASLEELLQSRSGVYHEAAAESESMKLNRPARGSHAPGTFWYYNNWDFNVAGAVLRQLTGEDLFQALYDRLAVPLGMTDFEPSDGFYLFDPVSEHPAYPFQMTARDMARFGVMMARDGTWGDQQIVPRSWVEKSLQPYSDAGGFWNYGYMWWVGKPDALDGHRMFAALGGSGHAIFVFPEDDLVVVHRVDANTYAHGWDEVYHLLGLVLDAHGR